MCGILGIYRPDSVFDPADARRRLEVGSRELSHRGPDAAGISLLAEHGLGLAHRRLSILDLDARSNQPLASPEGAVWLTYNGEIYNFRELRAELEGEGRRFSTSGDSEVLIQGYLHWGLRGLLERSVGMFAFGLYDARQRRLYLARDRAGEKPLYVAEHGGTVYFSSEVGALFKIWPGSRALSEDAFRAFLTLKFVPSPRTLFVGLRKVEPGTYLEFGAGRGEAAVRYWSPFDGGGPAPGQAVDRVDEALTKAVGRCLVSDVPVGVFLSGGVDSGLIAAKLSAAGARGTAAYTIGYRGMPEYDEREPARSAARRFGLEHREVVVEKEDVLSALQDSSLVQGEPIADWVWVPLHLMSRRARQDGLKVVLLGEGSDELFFGYDVMQKGLRDIELYSSRWGRGGARVLAALLSPVFSLARRGHRSYDLWRRAALGMPYWGSSIGFPPKQHGQLAGPALGAMNADLAEEFAAGCYRLYRERAPDPSDRVNLVCLIEFQAKMTEVLLNRVDRFTMRHSLESRAPFLDRDLVSLAFSIPGAGKLPGGRLKGLLKDVARRHLPPEAVDRPKMGFSFPFKDWLRGPLGPAVEGTFARSRLIKDGWVSGAFCRRLLGEHRSGWADHAPRLWTLFELCRWYDRWL